MARSNRKKAAAKAASQTPQTAGPQQKANLCSNSYSQPQLCKDGCPEGCVCLGDHAGCCRGQWTCGIGSNHKGEYHLCQKCIWTIKYNDKFAVATSYVDGAREEKEAAHIKKAQKVAQDATVAAVVAQQFVPPPPLPPPLPGLTAKAAGAPPAAQAAQ